MLLTSWMVLNLEGKGSGEFNFNYSTPRSPLLKIAIKGQPSGSLRMAREEVVEAAVVVAAAGAEAKPVSSGASGMPPTASCRKA